MNNSQQKLLEARADVFKALGHPSRLAIIDALVGGELCVHDLNKTVEADMSTVSRHLSVLRNAGILSSRKQGNQVFYKLECPCITTFYNCVESVLNRTGQPFELEGLK